MSAKRGKEVLEWATEMFGTALEFGIPLDRVWDEVQRSNMAKVDPETGRVARREDGKILKPKNWEGPRIGEVLEDAA